MKAIFGILGSLLLLYLAVAWVVLPAVGLMYGEWIALIPLLYAGTALAWARQEGARVSGWEYPVLFFAQRCIR